MSMLNLNEASLIDFNGPEPRKFKTDLQLPVTQKFLQLQVDDFKNHMESDKNSLKIDLTAAQKQLSREKDKVDRLEQQIDESRSK